MIGWCKARTTKGFLAIAKVTNTDTEQPGLSRYRRD